jgi:hypothetical protein
MTKFSDRCSCLAISTNRKCKLSGKSFNIKNKNYCFVHANILFSNSATTIQKHYQGYRIRKKLKKLFMPLPVDLQQKIIWYIRETHILKQHHYKPIQRILDKRLENQMLYQKYSLHYPFVGNPQFIGDVLAIAPNKAVEYYTKIIELYNLYSKYIEIANIDNCMALCKFASSTLKRVDKNISNDYNQIESDMMALKRCVQSTIKNFIYTCRFAYPDDVRELTYIYRIPYL